MAAKGKYGAKAMKDFNVEEILKSDKIPEGINPTLWFVIKSIKEDTAGIIHRVDILENQVKHLQEHRSKLDSNVDEFGHTLEILQAQLHRLDRRNSDLTASLENIKAKSMQNNLIFTFDRTVTDYKEVSGENCTELIKAFLKNVLAINDDIYIQNAYRLGKYMQGKQRPILATIPDGDDKYHIFKNISRLKNTGHFINQQMPASNTERRQFAMKEYQSKKADVRNKAMMKQDKLIIKGKVQKQYLRPNLSVPKTSDTSDLVITHSQDKRDGGSTFKGFCMRAKGTEDVARAIQHLSTRSDVMESSHVIYAYRFSGPNGKMEENFESDTDWGTGFELLKAMRDKNIVDHVCIAIRICKPGYSHIGKNRFMHINDLCVQAYEKL